MTSFTLEPLHESSWIAWLATAIIVTVFIAITPATVQPRQRRWLIAVRTVAAAILLLTMFGPTLVRSDNRPGEATLVVAVDTSSSMTLPAGDGTDRWSTQQSVWEELQPGLEGLDEFLRVELVAYDSSLNSIDEPSADALATIEPDGDATSLAIATQSALQLTQGSPLAGVVLIGDGTDTAGPDSGNPLTGAETLNSLGVPLWTVPIGPAGGSSNARDIAIESLPESLVLFSGNQFDASFEVRLRGMAGKDVTVRLEWLDDKNQSQQAASRNVIARNALDTVPVTVPLVVPEPGAYRLIVEADVVDGEVLSGNNRQTAFIDVRSGGGRVLYLEGAPRLEQFFLRRALTGFPDLDMTYQWIPADSDGQWPIDLGDWFSDDPFDVYVIGDLEANAIGTAQLKQLADTVGDGAGLITLGGFKSYGAGGYASSPLADVLPIRMDANDRSWVNRPVEQRPDQIDQPVRVQLAQQHPITDLGGDDPATVWGSLPELAGANRFGDIRAAPGVEVLLESAEQSPLLVVGEYGSGRVASLAIDSTFQWWRAGQQAAHRRFWRQLILWVLAREETGDTITIEMEDRRFPSGDRPEFVAGVQAIQERNDISLVAEVIGDAGEAFEVQVSSHSSDTRLTSAIQGVIPDLAPGFYRLRIQDRAGANELPAAELAFQVTDESRELENPHADPVFLEQLAAVTADHGGRAFRADQIDQLLATITNRRSQSESAFVEKLRLGDDPRSGWILFSIFAVALGVEWWLRRSWGLA